MSGDTTKDEFSKDLVATRSRNVKPVTLTLTAIEIFAIVSVVQAAEGENAIIPKKSSLGNFAQEVAKKMHDHLDPNSLLSLHLKEGWKLGESQPDLTTKANDTNSSREFREDVAGGESILPGSD